MLAGKHVNKAFRLVVLRYMQKLQPNARNLASVLPAKDNDIAAPYSYRFFQPNTVSTERVRNLRERCPAGSGEDGVCESFWKRLVTAILLNVLAVNCPNRNSELAQQYFRNR